MTISSKPKLPLSVPVIDFLSRDLKQGTSHWDSIRSQVRNALEEYGCFEALFDRVPAELRKATFKAVEDAFNLPMETKLSTKSEEIMYRGYVTFPTMPLYEGLGFYGAENPQVIEELTHKLWPQGNITFSKTIQSYAEKIIELNLMVRTMILESFGLDDKHIKEHLISAENQIQMIKYKGLENDTGEKIGFDPHLDRHFLTILCQSDHEDGLEIQTKDDEEWIKVKPSQDSSFLVIAGASLHLLLNGGVHPPIHRVFITSKKDRHVVALFLPPKQGVIIEAPEEIINDEHPRLYKPFDFEAYLKMTNVITMGSNLSTIKKFCGL